MRLFQYRNSACHCENINNTFCFHISLSVFGDAGLRAKFVDNAVKFIKKYEFNGLDIDWEYPNQRGGKPEDIESFTLLIKELKEKFDPEGLLLSAAVASVESSASLSYNIREISKYIDFINLMAYDLRGPWDAEKKVGINAPLYPSSKEDGLKKSWNVVCTSFQRNIFSVQSFNHQAFLH